VSLTCELCDESQVGDLCTGPPKLEDYDEKAVVEHLQFHSGVTAQRSDIYYT
jgi:hypothetical protein